MTPSRKCTAINFALCSLLLSFAALAHAAETIGTVLLLSGPLLVKKADGKSRILARNSVLAEGDTLATRKDSYAKLHFSDDSEIILQPETTLRIEKFYFDASQPQQDQARFALVSGGLQVTAGLLGKRSPERAILMTPQGEVNIGGATAIIEYREADVAAQAMLRAFLFASTAALDIADAAVRTDAPALSVSAPLLLAQLLLPSPTVMPSPTATRAPGLYVQVLDGLIHVTNPSGASNFSSGQFGYTPNFRTPPVILPVNPGMQFTPPPVFNQMVAPTSGTSPKSGTVDCVVR
jgi:hypothetical protein